MRSVPLFVCAARQQFLGLQGQERGGLTPRPLEKWPHPEQGRLWSAWRAASLEGKFKATKINLRTSLMGWVDKQESRCGIAETHERKQIHAPCQGVASTCSHLWHTWEVKHFIHVLRVTGPDTMTSLQLLQQLVPLCLCLLQTLL